MKTFLKIITFRIKKKYFDQIANGEKKIEYRREAPYYEFLKDLKTPFILKLHYQSGDYLFVIVNKVKKIKTPKSIDRNIIPSDYCWSLHLKKSFISK